MGRTIISLILAFLPQTTWALTPKIVPPLSLASLIESFDTNQKSLLESLYIFDLDAPYTLSPSQVSTFAAVTQAMKQTKLYNGETLLSLVSEIVAVAGEDDGAPSGHQFNLQVKWKKGIIAALVRSGFTYRVGWGHSDEWGLSYHSSSHGLHLLFSKEDDQKGHVHVDYRTFNLEVRGEEGHFGPYNADVRAVGPEIENGKPIDNYARHAEWYGPIPGYERDL